MRGEADEDADGVGFGQDHDGVEAEAGADESGRSDPAVLLKGGQLPRDGGGPGVDRRGAAAVLVVA